MPDHAAEALRLVYEHQATDKHGLYTITPTALTIATVHALLDIAAAIREQTAAQYERQAIVP